MPGRVLYVLNGFLRGGAEIGLFTLLRNGFLAESDFRIVALFRGDPTLRDAFADLVGEDRLIEVTDGPRMTVSSLAKGAAVLRDLIASFGPDTAILSLKQANIIGRSVLLGFPQVKVIAFEHITHFEKRLMSPLYAGLLRALSFRVDEIWADCAQTLHGARRYYGRRPERTERVAPLFVRPDNVRVKERFEIGPRARLAIAGRLIPRKRHDLLLQAVAQLSARRAISLDILGEGPEAQALQRLSQELGIADFVNFLGFQPQWWGRAADYDLFVHPSDQEGVCITAAEAMMTGLPVICTAVGGIRDYAEDAALCVPTGSAEALAAAIDTALGDAELRRTLGTAGARRIETLYGQAAFSRALDSLNRAVLAQRAA